MHLLYDASLWKVLITILSFLIFFFLLTDARRVRVVQCVGREKGRSKLSEARKERSWSRLILIFFWSATPGGFLFLFSLENLFVRIIISPTKTFFHDCRPPSPSFTLCRLPARVKFPPSCHRPSCQVTGSQLMDQLQPKTWCTSRNLPDIYEISMKSDWLTGI